MLSMALLPVFVFWYYDASFSQNIYIYLVFTAYTQKKYKTFFTQSTKKFYWSYRVGFLYKQLNVA